MIERLQKIKEILITRSIIITVITKQVLGREGERERMEYQEWLSFSSRSHIDKNYILYMYMYMSNLINDTDMYIHVRSIDKIKCYHYLSC